MVGATTEAAAISALGPPHRRLDRPDGMTILFWSHSRLRGPIVFIKSLQLAFDANDRLTHRPLVVERSTDILGN